MSRRLFLCQARSMRVAALRAAIALACLSAIALSSAVTAAAASPPANVPEVQVISGGIGVDEREALERAARDFNLKLVFALSTGNYVAEVPFEIVDAAGRTVVSHVALGPIAYAKLPPGRYTVNGKLGDSTQTRSVTVRSRGRAILHFRWRGLADDVAPA